MSNEASIQEPTTCSSEDEKLLEMASDYLRDAEEHEKEAEMMQDYISDGYENDAFEAIETDEKCEVDIQEIEPRHLLICSTQQFSTAPPSDM